MVGTIRTVRHESGLPLPSRARNLLSSIANSFSPFRAAPTAVRVQISSSCRASCHALGLAWAEPMPQGCAKSYLALRWVPVFAELLSLSFQKASSTEPSRTAYNRDFIGV
jgi:hypothetical protein